MARVPFSQFRALNGFVQLTFSVPTATQGDELLIGTVIGSNGMTSTLITPYRVASSFDVTAPVIGIVSPSAPDITHTIQIVFNGPGSRSLTVSGVVTDSSPISSVLVNGVTATLNSTASGASFSTVIPLTTGVNFIDVTARDVAGNVGFERTAVTAEPDVRMLFTASPTTTNQNGMVTYRAVLTTTEDMAATINFSEVEGIIRFTAA